MSARVTPEEIAGIRRLLEKSHPGGLRPVEIPRAVLDRLAQALFDLADLQDAVKELAEGLVLGAHPCVGRRHEPLVLATKVCRLAPNYGGSWFGCDDCAATPPADLPTAETEDLRYAPALRLALKLLEGSR